MQVLVFKTNVTRQSEVNSLQTLLLEFTDIKKISVDLEDCDKVLRIVGINPSPAQIEQVLSSLGLGCWEMED